MYSIQFCSPHLVDANSLNWPHQVSSVPTPWITAYNYRIKEKNVPTVLQRLKEITAIQPLGTEVWMPSKPLNWRLRLHGYFKNQRLEYSGFVLKARQTLQGHAIVMNIITYLQARLSRDISSPFRDSYLPSVAIPTKVCTLMSLLPILLEN